MMKLTVVALIVAFTTACADRSITTIEPQVKQLNDLRDLDGDGVIEAREKCADTYPGSTIDNYGCGGLRQVSESLNLDVKFANDSYQIPRQDYAKIQQVAEFLSRHPDNKVTIEGHTSKVGTQEYNQVLSENRAKAVALVLINNFKIEPDRISTVGYGFERLEAQGNSARAHAINRRILAELDGTEDVRNMIWTIYTVDQAK